MPTIDLTIPAPAPAGMLESLPRRLSLTLPELELLAELAGGAPLPFEVQETGAQSSLESRLGQSRQSGDDARYRQSIAELADARDSLSRRGLIGAEGVDPGVVGAIGLLATPSVALDLDVSIDGQRARAWHRQRDNAVATLATADGVVFELAWFDAVQWPAELTRAATPPTTEGRTDSAVPTWVDLPFELLDAGSEAARSGRTDLLAAITAQHSGGVHDSTGTALGDHEVQAIVTALGSETRGRLRALVADVDAGGSVVGVVSLVLVADGWRALVPHRVEQSTQVTVRRVTPDELPALLAPVLAEVSA